MHVHSEFRIESKGKNKESSFKGIVNFIEVIGGGRFCYFNVVIIFHFVGIDLISLKTYFHSSD